MSNYPNTDIPIDPISHIDESIETINRDDQLNQLNNLNNLNNINNQNIDSFINDPVFTNIHPNYLQPQQQQQLINNQLTAFNPRNNLPPLKPLSESVLPQAPYQLKDSSHRRSSSSTSNNATVQAPNVSHSSIRKPVKKKKEPTSKTRPAFVVKLWNMVNDTENRKYIRWMANGKSFKVLNREEFMKFILPKYFKHNNFASFVRQLNMYGWHKVQDITSGSLNSNDEVWQFECPFFQRGREDLLDSIVRNKSNSANDDEEIDFNVLLNELETIKLNQYAISEDLRRVRKDNETLWKENYLTRERHKTQADTLEKILHFLASVYGNNSSKVLGLGLPLENNDYTNQETNFNFPQSPYKPMLMLTNKSHRNSNSNSNSQSNMSSHSNSISSNNTRNMNSNINPNTNANTESPIQEIINNRNLNNLSTNTISSPRQLFPELNYHPSTPKQEPNIMNGLEENILKQGESIQQVQDWINKLNPNFTKPVANDEFDVNDFLNSETPQVEFDNMNSINSIDDDEMDNEGVPSKRLHEIEEIPVKKRRGSDV